MCFHHESFDNSIGIIFIINIHLFLISLVLVSPYKAILLLTVWNFIIFHTVVCLFHN